VHTFVHGRLSTRILVSSSWFCLHYFMQFSVSGDMTLQPRIVGFLGRSMFSGNVFGVICGWRTIRRQSAGVWDPDSSSGDGPGLVDPSWPVRVWTRGYLGVYWSLLSTATGLLAGEDDRKCQVHHGAALGTRSFVPQAEGCGKDHRGRTTKRSSRVRDVLKPFRSTPWLLCASDAPLGTPD
jgi:hypothetical protein